MKDFIAFTLAFFFIIAPHNTLAEQVRESWLIDTSPPRVPINPLTQAHIKEQALTKGAVWAEPVHVNESALSEDRFSIDLLDRSVTVLRTDPGLSSAIESNRAWLGNVVGAPEDGIPNVRLRSTGRGGVAGYVRLPDAIYVLRQLATGTHILVKRDRARMEDLSDDVINREEPRSEAAYPSSIDDEADDSATIRITIGFTSAALDGGTIQDLAADVTAAIDDAVLSMAASGVEVNLETAGYAVATYQESTVQQAVLDLALGSGGPFWLPYIARESERGDVLAIVVSTDATDNCGGAYGIGATKETAFFVVQRHCLENQTFAHELGHVMGADHQPEFALPEPFRAYGHAYYHSFNTQSEESDWATLMAAGCVPPQCSRLALFSSPDYEYNGVPVGTSDFHDNARVLNERKSIVGNFLPDPVEVRARDGQVLYTESGNSRF